MESQKGEEDQQQIGLPLGSRFRPPSTAEVKRIRDRWTSEARYLVSGEPAFWNWLVSYTKRLKDDPALKISIQQDTRNWLFGSKTVLFELVRALGYSGPTVFKRSTRLFSAENAATLYDAMVQANATDIQEELLEAGTVAGAAGATAQIERGLKQDRDALLLEVAKLKDVLVQNSGREQAWKAREQGLLDEADQLRGMLETCKRNAQKHASELQAYQAKVLDEDQPPPPPPPDVPEVDIPEAPPPPPPPMDDDENGGGGGGWEDSLNRIEERAKQVPIKAANNGRVLSASLQEQIRRGIALKAPTTQGPAKRDGELESNTETGLAAALAAALSARRPGLNPYPEDEQSDDDDTGFGSEPLRAGSALLRGILVNTCQWCGNEAYMMCPCESAYYCNEECKTKDVRAHYPVCAAAQYTVYAAGGSATFDFYVAPKSTPGYVGQYPKVGSPRAYRGVGPGGLALFGEDLILQDNTQYTFRATKDMSKHPMYLSLEARGATNAFLDRAVKGTLAERGSMFTFNTRDLPKTSYVVCNHHPYMGFAVHVDRK